MANRLAPVWMLAPASGRQKLSHFRYASKDDLLVVFPKVSVFIATSLDGYIARENGAIDWLESANVAIPKGEDCGYNAFFKSIDALVMGRNSYEKIISFGVWPYGQTPVTVLSSNPIKFPQVIPPTVKHSSEKPRQLCKRLACEGITHIYLDGGITIQRFLTEGLVDELTITLIPTLLGAGKSLFGPVPNDIQLSPIRTKMYDFGFVQIQYRVEKDA